MAEEKKYYIGTGNGAAAILDASGNPAQFVDLGEIPTFELDESIEYAENYSTAKGSANLLDMRVVIKRTLTVTMTVKEHLLRVLETIFQGESASVDASAVTDEELPLGFAAGDRYFTTHPNIANLVVTDDADASLTLGTHYTAEESGAITFLDVNSADAVAATGTIHFAAQPAADETVVVGGKTYTWKVTATLATHVEIGDDIETSVSNLATRINTDTASTLVTAERSPADIELTANTPGVAGNSITLTTDGVHLTDAGFSGGDAADVLVQPFHLAYDYGDRTKIDLMSKTPPHVALMLDGETLTDSPHKNLRARVDKILLSTSKVQLKTGSASGTGNTANEYELTGMAELKPGNTLSQGYGVIDIW